MKKLQRSVRSWFLWHVLTPSAIAIIAGLVALAVLLRTNEWRGDASDVISVFFVLLLVAGLLVAIPLLYLSWKRTAQYVLTLSDDATEAGVWMMKMAFGKLPDEDPIVHEFPWVRGAIPKSGKASQRISEWMDKWRAEAMAKSAVVSDELARDMELAQEFQQALLNRPYPEVPAVHIEGRLRLEFHHRYKPTMAVGGDFFDIIPIGNDCAGVFITDVMGHGVRSALITAILRALISELQTKARNASHFLKELNREFADILAVLPAPLFSSAFYLVADTTSRIATYACAGHPPPFQIHRDRGRVTRLTNPQPRGAALGLIEQENYPGETVRLLDGSTFIFFTDGVYECANPQGEEFGLTRMEKVLQTNIYKSTPEILDALIQAIDNFVKGAPLEDDVCLVAVDITTKPRPA